MLHALTRGGILTLLAACAPTGEVDTDATVDLGEDVRPAPGIDTRPPARTSHASGVTTGTPAPALDLPRLDTSGRWRLDELLGGPEDACPSGALLAFMARWCGPCAASLPTLAALGTTHPELEIVTVVVDDSPNGQQAELHKVRAAGLTGPVVLADPETTATWTGGRSSVPRFVFVDRAGLIVAQDRGFGDEVRALMPRQARRTLGH